jgi:hypothetical protein
MVGDSSTHVLSVFLSVLFSTLRFFGQTRRTLERFDTLQRSSAANAEIPTDTLIVETFLTFSAFCIALG